MVGPADDYVVNIQITLVVTGATGSFTNSTGSLLFSMTFPYHSTAIGSVTVS